jgi:hypothetical protein
MRPFAVLALLILGGFLGLVAGHDFAGWFAHSAATPDRAAVSDRPIERLTVGSPSWQRAAGLLVGDVTLVNDNDYPVSGVIIACDFFDARGNPVGTRGTAIRRVFGPGKTRVDGIEFIRFDRDTQGGACRVLSAKRLGMLTDDVE